MLESTSHTRHSTDSVVRLSCGQKKQNGRYAMSRLFPPRTGNTNRNRCEATFTERRQLRHPAPFRDQGDTSPVPKLTVRALYPHRMVVQCGPLQGYLLGQRKLVIVAMDQTRCSGQTVIECRRDGNESCGFESATIAEGRSKRIEDSTLPGTKFPMCSSRDRPLVRVGYGGLCIEMGG